MGLVAPARFFRSRRASRNAAPRARRIANRIADFWISWAARHPIDVEALRAEAGATLAQRSLPAEQKMDREAVEVLSDWAATRKAP